MRLFLYLGLIGAFAVLGFALTPVLGLLGILGGWASAVGILWAYDNAMEGGEHWNASGWLSDTPASDNIISSSTVDAGAPNGGDER